jgi:NTP pyrophosphatase (non-canonical NTP hydrolase)
MSITLGQLQQLIRDLYGVKDERRGLEGTFMWFMEEVGELAAALRGGTDADRATEFADVLAWLVTLANGASIDLDAAVAAKYGAGCPGCRQTPCSCNLAEKP